MCVAMLIELSESTPLSNYLGIFGRFWGLVPSAFTLLSNSQLADRNGVTVLVPSKFTLLSNLKSQIPTSNRERDTEICAVGEI